MTIQHPAEIVHLASSLLAEIGRHSTVDIDNNQASVGLQHNLARRRMHELAKEEGRQGVEAQEQVLSELESLFTDMTSNQIIVAGTFKELARSEPGQAQKLLQTCASTTKQIIAGTYDGQQLDSTMLDRLSVSTGGLTASESEKERLQQLASDVLTVHFGLLMLPNLVATGNLHAQTMTSKAYDLHATVRHARRFVALYQLMSGGKVDSERVCIKIPTTVPGLQAMRYLSSGGELDEFGVGGLLPEGRIQVLATTIFAVEQGLAAAQAAGALYTAPYINALAAHFFGADNPSAEQRAEAIDAGRRSVDETIVPLQRCLLRLRADDAASKTKVMAASFLSIDEAVALCGLDHMTLGASILEGLAKTEVNAAYAAATQQARSRFVAAPDAELEQYGAVLAAQEAGQLGCGGWLHPDSRSLARLNAALTQDDRCRFMLADALARFTASEIDLRNLF